MNRWKKSDIKICKDSQGYYSAHHTYAGLLFETEYYQNRKSARRQAVGVLLEKQAEESYR